MGSKYEDVCIMFEALLRTTEEVLRNQVGRMAEPVHHQPNLIISDPSAGLMDANGVTVVEKMEGTY